MSSTDLDPCPGTLVLENAKFATNADGKIIVRVSDDDAQAILNQILTELGGSAGAPIHIPDKRVTTPNTEQTTISVTVPVGKTRSVTKVVVSCRQSVKYRILIDAVEVGSGRTGAGNLNSSFIYTPPIVATTGQSIEVKVLQSQGQASDVETYLMALDL